MRRRNNQKGRPSKKAGSKRAQNSAAYLSKFRDSARIPSMITVPPSSQSGFAPDRVRTHLRFHTFGLIQNATSSSGSVRYEPTYAYDIDPTVGSTAMPGFAEWAGLYRKYRVNGCIAKITFANQEALPVLCYISATNSDPGTNVLPSVAQTFLAQPITRSELAGPLTGNSATKIMNLPVSVAGFAGSANHDIDDAYASFVTGTAPANNMWLQVGCVKSNNASLSAGVSFDLVIDLDIEFFEVTTPSA